MKPKAFVLSGLGIGCHEEVAHAYNLAGADAEIVHIKQILSGEKNIFESQIINLTGGFLHGDMLGAGMCAANEFEHAMKEIGDEGEKKLKDVFLEYQEKSNILYGQCNGFQLLVKTGLLPGMDNNYDEQTLTLTHNDSGNYWVSPVMHKPSKDHFMFEGINKPFYLWCRHGEGKIEFSSKFGKIDSETATVNRYKVNKVHTLMKYVHPKTEEVTNDFPHNPNGSVDAVAGLTNENGNIIGHMAHPEVSIYTSRNPNWYKLKDLARRAGMKSEEFEKEFKYDVGKTIFKNIVKRVA